MLGSAPSLGFSLTLVADRAQNSASCASPCRATSLDTYDVEAVERWFGAHPQIHTICRDRNGRYAKAAHAGAPAALQVADRFHLVQNLRETIERELAVHRARLHVARDGSVVPTAPVIASGRDPNI